MSVNAEYCDPFASDKQDIWVKLEHCGRYIFAGDFLAMKGCESVLDVACSNGYGSHMLCERGFRVIAADKNKSYMDSWYLKQNGVKTFCFDFDDAWPCSVPSVNGIVCFETIEHLRFPFPFIKKLSCHVDTNGWLLLSFPNAVYERLELDGSNRDPYHLHVLNSKDVASTLSANGFRVVKIMGQPVCNELLLRQHELHAKGSVTPSDIDDAFSYTRQSIIALSRLMAYPQATRLKKSYSFIFVAQKI